MSDSVYLSTLNRPDLGLLSPLPLEITGSSGNYVATWVEGPVEGEGETRDEAVEDCRRALVEEFGRLRDKLTKTGHSSEEDRVWNGLLHYVVEAGRRPLAVGEEYGVSNPADDDYKGPFFG